jgi:hypothetical protein
MKVVLITLLSAGLASPYPLDGAARTGIRRLAGMQKFGKLPPGALRTSAEIRLRLVGSDFDIAPGIKPDGDLQKSLEQIFAARDPSYSVAMLDITNPERPRYAALRADEKRIPGSVGKLLVATGFLGALQRRFPRDVAAREKFLRETIVAANNFVYRDGKTVPFFSDGRMLNRRIEAGDKFNLYEWLDHMLSHSSNAAASMVWRQAMLLHNAAQEEAFFAETPKLELGKLALTTIETPMRESGLDTGKLRIGTFFTSNASRVIPGTASYATPNELLRWLIKMEQGKLVDAWSSLELKRLLYFTRFRYRYASSPALRDAAVYFKSGSLFECAPEPGYQCVQYRGNKVNLMHSVAVVESGAKVYLVAMMSNVLRLNSAVEHQTIATLIERIMNPVAKSR